MIDDIMELELHSTQIWKYQFKKIQIEEFCNKWIQNWTFCMGFVLGWTHQDGLDMINISLENKLMGLGLLKIIWKIGVRGFLVGPVSYISNTVITLVHQYLSNLFFSQGLWAQSRGERICFCFVVLRIMFRISGYFVKFPIKISKI